ncbi:hypothetical protein CERZMDRAFT_99537 [Cercospora zeae-maydis SCOH1-5]|uniref:F-box domain-containing protein n=1 Tax=Cercospora zeae-maydis SCOH1-5 TaxID=717836 RepID=A0A6A6FAZ7_9PEZI|nr:hypothetical protein CERZMDRAFT_99537 [Cercospora zeae-maydis SCOH1-5]
MGHDSMPMTASRKQIESRSRTPIGDPDHAAQSPGPSLHGQHTRRRFVFLTKRAASKETCSDQGSSHTSTPYSAKFNVSQPLLSTDMDNFKILSEVSSADSASLLGPAVKDYANERVLSETALDGFFNYLSLEDLLTCRRVCKSWSQAITLSREWKEQLFLAPAPSNHHQPAAKLNPLLTSISSKVSQLHYIHDNLVCDTMTRLFPEDHNLVFSWKGRYYRPQTFFSRSSNPALSSASSLSNTSSPCLEWQLRELSRYEICSLKNSTVFPGPESSLWKMYLCQPPPIEIHITIWEMDNAYEDDSRLPKESTEGHVTERFVLKAWSIREMFERMDDARNEDKRAQKAGLGENTSKRKMDKFRHLFHNDNSRRSSSSSSMSPSTFFHNTSQYRLPPTPSPSPLRSAKPKITSNAIRIGTSANTCPIKPPSFPGPATPSSSYSKPSSISSLASSTSQARKKVHQVLQSNASTMTVGLGGYVEHAISSSEARKAGE